TGNSDRTSEPAIESQGRLRPWSWISALDAGQRPGWRALCANCSVIKNSYNGRLTQANVAELVDAPDLGSGAERCESSSLSVRTMNWPKCQFSRGSWGQDGAFGK